MCKLDMKGAFFSSTTSLIKETSSVFLVRESLRVPLLMLWLGTSSKNIQKIAKNTNINNEEDRYSGSNITG